MIPAEFGPLRAGACQYGTGCTATLVVPVQPTTCSKPTAWHLCEKHFDHENFEIYGIASTASEADFHPHILPFESKP
jgi:hypothetical protein